MPRSLIAIGRLTPTAYDLLFPQSLKKYLMLLLVTISVLCQLLSDYYWIHNKELYSWR